MQYTIESLMQAIGYEKWPSYWNDIFEDAMAKYDREGCRLADPEFYRDLHEKYACFPEELASFMDAAREVGKDEVLSRFLTLLDIAVQDRSRLHKEAKIITPLVTPEGKSPLAYKMVLALSFAATMEYTVRKCQERTFTEDRANYLIHAIDKSVHRYRIAHDGQPGYAGPFWWTQLYVDAYLFDFGNLILDLSGGREGPSCVYINEAGEQAVLVDGLRVHRSGRPLGSAGCEDEEGSWMAEIVETEDSYTGYGVLPDGLIADYPVTLSKSHWRLLLGREEKVLRLHIPSKAKFDPESVEKTLRDICLFINEHYKEIPNYIFSCNSWMLDPQLKQMLGPNSNIVHFQNRFRKMPRISAGQAILHFIFGKKNILPDEWDTLPQNSRLQKAIAEHYKSGKYIYETCGYFLYDPAKNNAALKSGVVMAQREDMPFPARVDLTRLEDRIEAFEAQQILTGKILFYGDSAFTRWGPQRGFRPMAEDLCAKDGSVAVVNHGFGTSTAEEQLYYYPRAVLPWKPRAIVLETGGNDLGSGYSPEEIMMLQARFCELARKDLPGIHFYICGMLPLKRHVKNTKLHEKWRKLNQLREEYCSKHDDCTFLQFINSPLFYDSAEDVGSYEQIRTDIFVGDEVHYNQKGYDLFRRFFLEALDDLL